VIVFGSIWSGVTTDCGGGAAITGGVSWAGGVRRSEARGPNFVSSGTRGSTGSSVTGSLSGGLCGARLASPGRVTMSTLSRTGSSKGF
jgi:hypothetical protein